MRRFVFLPAVLVVLAACAPKPSTTATPADAEADEPPPELEPLPVDAVLWEGKLPEGVEASSLLDKEGLLTRTKKPTENQARWWPFSLDYWGIARTDLKALLQPHVGRRVRVTGHYKKIYSDGTWDYEVEPVKITALAAVPDAEAESEPAPAP